MNILVFGKDGQLGKAIQAELKKPQYSAVNSVRFIGRSDCDLSDPQQLFATLEQCNPQLIINAAAYTACLLYTSPSPRDLSTSRMPSSA